MSVYCDERRGKKKHWRYRAKIQLHDGRTERISGTPAINTKLGALAAERAHVERRLRGHSDGEPEKKEVLTLTRFIDEVWWPTYPTGRGNRPTTIQEKEIHVRLHLKPALGRLLLTDINAQNVTGLFGDLRTLGHSRKGKPAREGLKRRRREEEKLRATRERHRKPRGLKDKSIRNIRTTLSTILSSAVEWGYLAAMPRLPKVKVDDPQWEWYRAEEARRLVAAARDEWDRAMLLFPLATGARMGEQIAIRWGDIDWMSRMVHIRQSAPNGLRTVRWPHNRPCRTHQPSRQRRAAHETSVIGNSSCRQCTEATVDVSPRCAAHQMMPGNPYSRTCLAASSTCPMSRDSARASCVAVETSSIDD